MKWSIAFLRLELSAVPTTCCAGSVAEADLPSASLDSSSVRFADTDGQTIQKAWCTIRRKAAVNELQRHTANHILRPAWVIPETVNQRLSGAKFVLILIDCYNLPRQ